MADRQMLHRSVWQECCFEPGVIVDRNEEDAGRRTYLRKLNEKGMNRKSGRIVLQFARFFVTLRSE